jgi:hypothetical protein
VRKPIQPPNSDPRVEGQSGVYTGKQVLGRCSEKRVGRTLQADHLHFVNRPPRFAFGVERRNSLVMFYPHARDALVGIKHLHFVFLPAPTNSYCEVADIIF